MSINDENYSNITNGNKCNAGIALSSNESFLLVGSNCVNIPTRLSYGI